MAYDKYCDGESDFWWGVLFSCVCVIFLICMYFGFRTTPEQIAACEASTGWSTERCVTELTR